MNISRCHGDRLGVVEGSNILDVTAALQDLPKPDWPYPQGDPLRRTFGAWRDARCRPRKGKMRASAAAPQPARCTFRAACCR